MARLQIITTSLLIFASAHQTYVADLPNGNNVTGAAASAFNSPFFLKGCTPATPHQIPAPPHLTNPSYIKQLVTPTLRAAAAAMLSAPFLERIKLIRQGGQRPFAVRTATAVSLSGLPCPPKRHPKKITPHSNPASLTFIDGQTNGMELGDPCCLWKKGNVPNVSLFARLAASPHSESLTPKPPAKIQFTSDISHPGLKSETTKRAVPACVAVVCKK